MTFDERRSPERILRYFELLEWNKDKTSDEVTERFRQELQPIEEELYTSEQLITEKNRFLLSEQEEINQVRSNIFRAEELVRDIGRDIISTRSKIAEHNQKFFKENRVTPFDRSKHTSASTLDFMEIFTQLFLGIREDIRALFLDIWQAIITLKIFVLAQYFLSFLIVIIFAYQFDYDINATVSLIIIVIYLCFNLFRILNRTNKNQKIVSEKKGNF